MMGVRRGRCCGNSRCTRYRTCILIGRARGIMSTHLSGMLMEVAFLLVEVVVEVIALVLQISPGESSNISVLSALEVLHEPHSVCEKDAAEANMRAMLVTLDTSHLEMSLLNDEAE